MTTSKIELYTATDAENDKMDIMADFADGTINAQEKEERLFQVRIARKRSIEYYGYSNGN